jgi:hypothetical protein
MNLLDSTVNFQFNQAVAHYLSLEEAIVLGWIEHQLQNKSTTWQAVETCFSFWREEILAQTFAQLQGKQLISEKRDRQGNCRFVINASKYSELTGQTLQQDNTQHLPTAQPAILDSNIKKHLQRFQNNDSVLNKKLSQLIHENHQQMIHYATAEGLSLELANASFDKFLHYVSSHPDKFWNTDLTSYWGFWVSNNIDRQKLTTKGQGKRSAVERSNLHAGSNWLKKKASNPLLTSNVTITQK